MILTTIGMMSEALIFGFVTELVGLVRPRREHHVALMIGGQTHLVRDYRNQLL